MKTTGILSAGKWINEMQCIYTLEYYLVIKSDGVVIHGTIFINFEITMLSESS